MRLAVGALTTAVMAVVGLSLYANGSPTPAVVLGVMAVYRGYYVAWGVWALVTPDDDDDDVVSGF